MDLIRKTAFVTRFSKINPGADGEFSIVCTDDRSPPLHGYYLNALRLRTLPEEAEYVSSIGLSNSIDGDQDVTEYFDDETLYVTVHDIRLDPNQGEARVFLTFNARPNYVGRLSLEPQANGSFKGSLKLAYLPLGENKLTIIGSTEEKGEREEILKHVSSVYISTAVQLGNEGLD